MSYCKASASSQTELVPIMPLTVEDLAKIYAREHMRIVRRLERDRQLIMFYRNIDCRYFDFDTIKNIRNRFKENYSCCQEQCPIIRARMQQHMLERHCSARNARTGDVAGPRTTRGLNSRTPSGRLIPSAAGGSTRTLLNPMPNYSNTYITNTDYFCDKAVSYSGASVRVLDTNIEDTIKSQLKYELDNIFEDIPLNPKTKETMLSTLADDLSKVIVNVELDTDSKIKDEIDEMVNKLLMNHPASKFDKYKLVGDLRARLFDIVKDKQQYIKNKDSRNVDTVSAYSDISNSCDEKGTNASRLKDVTDDIKKLFENYPIHTETKLSKEAKDNLLNKLIDDINQIVKSTTMANSEKKAEIEKILEDLHSKYPEHSASQEIYKNEIRDKLFNLMKTKTKDVTDPIRKLFENYPVHTETELSKEAKDNLLNKIIDNVNQIVNNKTMSDTGKKDEIEKLLDNFNAKFTETTNDIVKQKQKNEIREKLFDLIDTKPEVSKKKREVPTNNAVDLSSPSGTSGRGGTGGSSGKKGRNKNSTFEAAGSRNNGSGTNNKSFGLNNKTVGISSGGGMNSKMIGNKTTNKLYGGASNDNARRVSGNRARGVNNGANSTGTIGNGVGPNDGVMSGFSGGPENKSQINNRFDNFIPDKKFSQEVTKFFEDHPIFAQSPQSQDTKDNTIRHLVEDVNNLVANNKILRDDDILKEVDKIVDKLHARYPGHKSIQIQYKNEIRDKLYDMINNARDNNIGNRRSSGKDRNNEAGPSKKHPTNHEYDFKQSLNKALSDIAIYPQKKDGHRDSVINNLFDDITWIADSVKPENDDDLNREIEISLDRHHLWYPGAKRDQTEYRNNIRDRLFNVIKEYHKNKPKIDTIDESIVSVSSYDSDSFNTGQDSRTIKYWVNQLKHEKFMIGVDTNELIKKLNKRILPILKSNNCCGKITILKGAVLEILSEIPGAANCNNKVQRMVSDLVNNLYCRYKNDCCSSAGSKRTTLYVETIQNYWKSDKLMKLKDFLDNNNMAQNSHVRNEIAYLIMAGDEEPVDSSVECDLQNDLNEFLENDTTQVLASKVLNTYNDKITCHNNDDDNYDRDEDFLNRIFFKNVSIYTSETSCCATSTPNKSANKVVQKLNDEERKYINDLSNFIRAWMETLPVQFNSPEEKSFKDAVIAELAGEIMDIAKIAQISPRTKEELDDYHFHLLVKWLNKLNMLDQNRLNDQVENFMTRLEDIPVPILTRPHQGNRQLMDNIKLREEQGWRKDFLPKGIDILEDEISIWVNEQPSDMFNFSRDSRNNKIHSLAENIQTKLKNKSAENEINCDIERWLNDIIRRDKCVNVDEVRESLKHRIIKLPGDTTVTAKYDKKQKERAMAAELMENLKNEPKQVRKDEDTLDIDRTMKDFIEKFIDHHYDVDDPMAIRTFNYLLKRKLQRINTPVTNKDDCQGSCSKKKALSPQKLYEELELVKTVSDWLKNIPMTEGETYHSVGNRDRVDLVLDLTRALKALEDEREKAPCAMDHDLYLASTIHSYFCNMPIVQEYLVDNLAHVIKQLMHRVSVWRELIAKKRIETFSDSGINDENIGDFIEEFIRHHGTEIANDGVKMEAWSIRLLREVKIMVQNASDPKILTKMQIYNKLTSVPIPGDDTVERFDRELVYIEEIMEWMKNLPLLPIDEQEKTEEEENRRIMVCDLAKTIAEKENLADDAEFKEYLTYWIQDLPLDQNREINIPFLIDQLIRRIERTMADGKIVGASDGKTIKSKSKSKYNDLLKSPGKHSKNPGIMATDAIEKWTNSLPIKSDLDAKGSIERKLYKKVGEFNSDPIVYRDDLLYQTLLTVEVDDVLDKLPGGDDLQKTMEKQNKELVKSLVDARKLAKEHGAGDDYKHRLERTINASIPIPITYKQVFDPAFEIYKSRLADVFILENFDHSNDEVKMKYERQIKDEIDKYYNSAARRNATRLTNHEIYTELYSALFKVPIPNEKSVMEEVEQIKTRCVIDAWVDTLPLIRKDTLFEQLELDKKVEMLAKRIHEIEKLPKSEEKLTKKILMWLANVPLQPSKKIYIQKYTDQLKKQLKASTHQRKCFSEKDAKNKKGKSKLKIKQKKSKHNESQIPGPSAVDTPLQPSTRVQQKKAADLIVDKVEQWSNTIPLLSHGKIDAETIRNDVVRKVLIQISDINTNPDIFNNDYIYKVILDEALDKIFNEIPKCCDFEPNEKALIKSKLITELTELKPLIKEERVKFNYIHDLNNTVDRILETPNNLSSNKISEYDALKDDIVENFVQIHYDKNDDEGRLEYKARVHDAVFKFLDDVTGEKNQNTLMKMNQLLCELAKVPVTKEVLREEVDEVRMKNEITEFFDVNNVKSKDKPIDVLITSLARKLINIENGGHNRENDDKMKNEVTRTLKKLNKELKPRTVEGFVNKLKANEYIRKKNVAKDDTVSEESCKMLKSRRNVDIMYPKDQIPCDNTCPYMANLLKPYDNATCTHQTDNKNTFDFPRSDIQNIKKINEICKDIFPNNPTEPTSCDESSCTNQSIEDNNNDKACDSTCPKKQNTKKNVKICKDTCLPKSKEPTPYEESSFTNQINKNNTCQTQQTDETCPNKNLQTNPLDSKTIQTQNTEDHHHQRRGSKSSNRDYSETEDENAELLAQKREEVCPCELRLRQMREMWRHYMAVARWRCEGPKDPFCTDSSGLGREMTPERPMMTHSRRNS